jgi:hypothetical protein
MPHKIHTPLQHNWGRYIFTIAHQVVSKMCTKFVYNCVVVAVTMAEQQLSRGVALEVNQDSQNTDPMVEYSHTD